MGVFRQIGQLFWKNVLLRKREPYILLLELVWPVFIFIIVAVIRTAVPPVDKPSCSYAPHAMPSAGLVPFLQSSICNIDNKCEAKDSIDNRLAKANKLSKLVSDIEPYITQESTLNALNSIETAKDLALAIVDPANNITANNFLGNDTLQLKSFFKDPGKVKQILVQDLRVMSSEVADSFLSSSVNILELINSLTTGYIDFRGIVCDPVKLKSYMFFTKNTNVTMVSKELCDIPDSAIPGITELVQQQIDIAAIFRVAKSFTTLTNDYVLGDAIDDIATMMDLLAGTTGLSGLFGADIDGIKAMLYNIPMYIDTLNKFSKVDTRSLNDVLKWVDPLVTRYTEDRTAWNETKQLFYKLRDLSDAVGSGTTANWTAVMESTTSLLGMLGTNMSVLESLMIVPLSDVTDMATQLMQGNMSVQEWLSGQSSMNMLQSLMDNILGVPTTQMVLGLVDTSMDMASMTVTYIQDTHASMESVITSDSVVLDAVKKLFGYGPNVTMAVMGRMLQPDNIMTLYNNTNSYVMICRDALSEVKEINATTRSTLEGALCVEGVTTAVNNMVAAFNTQSYQKQMETFFMKMDRILGQTAVSTDMKLDDVYVKVMNTTTDLQAMIGASWFGNVVSSAGVNADEWTSIGNQMSTMISVQASLPVVIVTVGPLLEETGMWKTMQPMLNAVSIYMDSMVQQMEQLQSPTSSTAQMNEMLKYVQYSPEIVQGVFNMMKDEQMMKDVFSSQSMEEFCQQKFLLNMSVPSYVPMYEINDMVCNTNWQEMMADMTSTYDVAGTLEKATSALSANYTELYKFDWSGMVEKTSKVMTMFNNPESLMTGNPIVTLLSMNMSFIGETMNVVMYNLQQMSTQNVASMASNSVTWLEQLDSSMTNDSTWRTLKVYVDVWNSYTVLTNKLMENSDFSFLGFDSLLNMSSTLSDFIINSAGSLPELIDALKNTTVSSSQFFRVLLNGDWSKLCQGESIMGLFSSSVNLQQFEDKLCKLNWTKIAMELAENQDPVLQTYMEKVSRLAMMDFSNVPNIDLDWERVINNTEKMFTLLMKVDTAKMEEALSWDSLLNKFDMKNANISWSNFVDVFTRQQFIDVENLNTVLDGLSSVALTLASTGSNDSLSSLGVSMLQYQMYSQLQISNFIVKQLQILNDTRPIDIRQLFNSDEMNKLLVGFFISNDVSRVVLHTMIETLKNPTKMNELMISWPSICSDLSIFTSIMSIPANVSVSHADLQAKICGVNINTTKLYEELMAGVDGLPELLQAMTHFNGTATVTDMWETYQRLEQLMNALTINPPNVSFKHFGDSWLSETEYAGVWEDFVSHINEGLKPENYMNSLTSLSQQTTAVMLQNLASIPEVNTILQQLSVYMKVAMARLNQSKSITDLQMMFDGYPEMERALDLMNDLPHLYQVWVYNSLFSSDKIFNLFAATKSWDQFCGMTGILSDLPGSNFSVSGFQTALCKLNLTKLLEESTRYNAIPEIEQLFSNGTSTTSINSTELVNQFNQFSQFFLSYLEKVSSSGVGNVSLPGFLDMQRWSDAMNQLNMIIGDPARLAQLATSIPNYLESTNNVTGLEALLHVLIDTDASFRQLVQTTKAIYHVIEHFLNKINNKTVIGMDDIFGNATETMKLWDLFVQPGVLEVLLNSVNTPKMTALFANDNVTSVIITLCYTGNFSEYFVVPRGVNVDLDKLQNDFCAIDLMKVMTELMQESEAINTIITESFNNSTSGADVLSIFMGIEKLTTPLTTLMTNPPTFDLPPSWMNASYWLNILAHYTESRQDQQDIMKELLTFMNSVQPMLMEEPFRSVGHIMDTYLQLLLDNLQAINSTALTLDNLFSSIPTLSAVYSTLQINDSALIELLQSPIKNPAEFVKLLSMEDPYKYFCEDEKHWHVIFIVSADTPDKICSGNTSEILENLMRELRVTDYLSAVQNASSIPDWMNIITNSMKLSEMLTNLITSSNVKFGASKTLQALSQYNNTDFLWNFLSYLQSFTSTSNDTIMNQLLFSFQSTQMGLQLTNLIFDKFLQPGNKLDFGVFLKNSSSVATLLNSLGINGESVNQLFSGFLKPGKVSEFLAVIGDPSSLQSFLCDAQQWNDMFQLSVNITDIVDSLCRTNESNILMMLMDQFHLDDIMSLVMNQNSSFDIKTMVADVERLTANILALFNVTAADFGGVNFDHILNLNMTALEAAIMKETEKLQGVYPDMYAQLLENILKSSVNTSDPTSATMVTVMAAANVWLSVFSRQMKDINYQPMNVSMLLHGSSVGKAIDMVLQNPEWMEELAQAQIDPEKLSSYLMSNFSAICSDEFWDDVVTHGNLSAVYKVWQAICAMNETTIAQEAMSGFVSNYLFQQQLTVLMGELNKGVINMTTLYPNIMEFSNTLMTMMQNTDVTKVFNVTSFVSVLDRLGKTLMESIETQIPQWTSMLTSIIPQDKTLVKSIQTVSLIMQEINNRLSLLQGTSATSMLIQNSTELFSIIDSMFRKVQNGTIVSNEIDVNKLSEVIGSSELFTTLCKAKTLGDYITPDGVVSQLARDLGNVMCIYPDALQQVLMDQSKTDILQKQLEDIWNSTNPGAADWMGVQQSVTNFTNLLMALVQRPPNSGVTDMLDMSLVLRSLEGMFTSPQMMFAMTNSFSLMLQSYTVDPVVYPYYLSWLEVYKQMHKVISSLEGSAVDSQGAVQSLWNSMSSLNSHLDFIQQNSTYAELVSDLGSDPSLQSHVCDVAQIEAAGSTAPERVREALCGQDPQVWNQRLVNAGFPEYYGYFLLIIMKPDSGSSMNMGELLNRFMTQVQNLTDTLSKMSTPDLNKLQNILIGDWRNPTISDEFYQSFNWLNLNDNSTKTWLLGMLNFVTEVNAYVERQLSVLKGMGVKVPFTVLLPNNTAIAELLGAALRSQTAAVTMAFNLAPEKFMEVAFSNTWQEKVCKDVATFADVFGLTPDSGVNVTALQHDLCADLSKQDSAIRDILNRLDMNDVFKAFDDWMLGKTVSTHNTTDAFKAIQNKIEEFVTMVIKIENVTLTQDGLDGWLSPIWNAMSKLNKPQDSIGETCDATLFYIENTAMYRNEIRPILAGIYLNMESTINQMRLQSAVEELICTEAKNSSDFLQNLFSSNITSMLLKVLNPNMTISGDFRCSNMVALSERLNSIINQSVYSMSGMAGCGDNVYKNVMMLLTDATVSFQVMQELVKLMSDPGLRTILNLDPQVMTIMQLIMESYSKQQSVSIKVQDLITSPGDFNTKLQQTVKLAPEIIDSFLLSTLNPNTKLLSNISSTDLKALLCNSTALGQTLTLPAIGNLSTSDLTEALCFNSSDVVLDIIRSVLNMELLESLGKLNTTDLTWWTVTLSHLGDVIGHLNSLSSLPNLDFSKLDFANLQTDLLIYMQKFLFDNGPEVIAKSLNLLVEDFARLDPAVMTSTIVKDIQAVTLGLTSLKVVRNFIPPNVLIRDVLSDRDGFLNYLTHQLNISSDVANALISSTLQYAALVKYEEKDIQGLLCNATRLKTVLELPPESNVTVQHVITSLCSLSEAKAINLTQSLIRELDIGDMVKMYVSAGLDSFFLSLNKSQEDVRAAVKSLTSSQDDFKQTLDAFKKSTEELDLNIFLEPEYLTGEQSKQTFGDLLCGYEISKIENSDGGKDLTGASSQLSAVTEMVLRQEQELQEMPDACKNVYDLIKGMGNGPVLWEYLKPLLWGKLLYTPDTPTSRLIAENVYNSSFRALADVQRFTSTWAKGTKNIMDLIKDGNMKSKLESVMGNQLISSMMSTLFGVSASDFLNGFYSLDSVNTSQIDAMASIASTMNDYLGCVVTSGDRFEGVGTEQLLEVRAGELNKKKQFFAGLVFNNLGSSSGTRKKRSTSASIPKHVSYTIRMDIDNVMYTRVIKEQYWQPKPEDNFFTELRYLRGFLQLQDILDRSIISIQSGTQPDNTVYMQQFPSTCYKRDIFLFTLSSFLLPILMTIAWLVSVAIATRNLLNDRENGQEEILRIMGMSSVVNWWVWFISTMIVMSVVAALCILTLRLGGLYTFSNSGILFLYFLTFCFSSVMMCYMVSSFFTRTTLALLSVVIVYFLSYLPYILLVSLDAQMEFWERTLACLSSTTAFGFAAHHLARYETLMEGIQWSNIASSPIPGDRTSFSWTCIMMVIDGAIYLVIGWYVRNVKPGKYGVAKPWYFILSPYYWGRCTRSGSSADKYKQEAEGLNEPMDKKMVAGIRINNLTKKYGDTVVVNNINADFYEHQVTILLGHNGAAKTTTLNMITGVLQPTSGNVMIHGKSSSTAKNVGICPQHSALFDYMTVEEHMKFYGTIKSDWSKMQLEDNIYQLLKDVGLLHVRDSRVSQLSGGMQKRLSVALAFVGGSEVVILDEPSSGVDPSARRAMWNLIMKRKMDCTVLLSTHFLDEADMIGDRIAIMHNGRIMCTGSPHYLKAYLGSGYHLKIAKGDSCDQMSVMGLISSLLPKTDLVEDIGAEMTVSLSATVANVDNLQKCLHELDSKGSELSIASYGLYDTTLEEVFLKVCDVCDKGHHLTDEVMHDLRKQTKIESKKTSGENRPTHDFEGDSREIPYADPRERVSTASQSVQQIGALLLKRFHHYRRDWRMLIGLVLLPLIFVTAGLGFYTLKPTLSAPKILLTPALYGPHAYVFNQDNVKSTMSRKMRYQLYAPPGPGTSCMAGMDLSNPFMCVPSETSFHTPSTPSGTPQCSCVESKYTCNDAAKNQQVPWITTNTTDRLLDLDGHDITDYLQMTRSEFIEKRYGGWSFDTQDSTLKSTVWFNNKGHHSLPSFYNTLSNTILRSTVSSEPEKYGISVYSHPLMLTNGQLNEDTLIQKAADFGIGAIFLIAFTFITAGLAVFVVNEYVHKEKQLQYLSGVGPFMYWTTSLLWDMFLYCTMLGISVGIMAAFKGDVYWNRDNLKATVALIVLYGWATLPQLYATVKCFRDSTTAYMVMFCLNVFIGIIAMAIVFILQFFSHTESIGDAYTVMRHLFKIFPPYNLVNGFVELISNHLMADILSRFGDDPYVWPFSFDVIGWHLVAMAITGFVFFVVTLILEFRCSCSSGWRHDEEVDNLDEAVINEKKRVMSGYAHDDLLVVKNLTKEYKRGRREFYAVDHISVGVPHGECFGLLGENGAGKTTSFKMLTGDVIPTAGEALIKGQRVTQGDLSIGQEVGYCPQEDALDGRLTGREMLHCYAKLRGLPTKSRNYVVDSLIKQFDMKEADKTVHTYSGGMKRKLSVAMAMIGEPPVVLLDEPTTGMDPNTRRHVWNLILAAVKNRQSVVLSSHSMEECDALCTRLAIMVNGEFRCLGSPQQLKHKYGNGYIVTIYLSGLSTSKVRIRDSFITTFHGAHTQDAVVSFEDHQGVLQIEVPKGKTSVADIFEHLERMKHEFNIIHYSVSQTTLDNVFLHLTKDQNDGIPSSEMYDSSTEGSHSADTWGEGSVDAFSNPAYSYTNTGFTPDKDSLQARFMGNWTDSTKM